MRVCGKVLEETHGSAPSMDSLHGVQYFRVKDNEAEPFQMDGVYLLPLFTVILHTQEYILGKLLLPGSCFSFKVMGLWCKESHSSLYVLGTQRMSARIHV